MITDPTITVDLATSVPILQIRGILDDASSSDFGEAAQRALLGAPQEILVDCSRLRFVDAAGLHALLDLHRLMPDGGNLIVVGASPLIRRLLHLTALDQTFHIVGDC